ncbi:Rne/Rng family ribonuclease [Polluticaenibacter yanchengensis]|uniref:Rne/Rng family ribonuclease n=1 Tax=Polluticaenibacter yanchengensis TaxID=3014562 RepID=A0ABT4UHB7_9BACT|nr:Rne/Rng family ribonuclease [Chitinophagaceae bacterium LY-5]
MNKELIINSSATGVDIALIEDKKLVELHREANDNAFVVGDLYLGKVRKLMLGLNAAFIDVGYEKDAFLHYTDLSPYVKSLLKFTQISQDWKAPEIYDFSRFSVEPEIVKSGKINEVLSGKPNILVQILKEPIAAKGPRLSCEISLPGRFVVLTPFNDIVAVSKKIHSSDERRRLQKIIDAIKPKNFGVIVRTAAEGKNTAELHDDLNALVAKWKDIQQSLKGAAAPKRILSEQGKTTSIIRDLLSADFNKIVVNEKNTYDEAVGYIRKVAPEKVDIVHFYNQAAPIFDTYGVTKQVKHAFGKTVSLPSGAYLIIEHTEALHVIDVNSGYKSAGNNQEENSLQTNLEAAEEIARQMRLRDLGGIVVVDFIDMKLPDNKKKVLEAMEAHMKLDRSKHSIVPISKFGLMQITRQRMKPEVIIKTEEVCPTCNGTGKVGSSIILEDEIYNTLEYLFSQGHKKLDVLVNPIFHAFLTKGIWSKKRQWSWKFKQLIKITPNNTLNLVEFKILNEEGDEIIL